jgi:hypothetical protein
VFLWDTGDPYGATRCRDPADSGLNNLTSATIRYFNVSSFRSLKCLFPCIYLHRFQYHNQRLVDRVRF